MREGNVGRGSVRRELMIPYSAVANLDDRFVARVLCDECGIVSHKLPTSE